MKRIRSLFAIVLVIAMLSSLAVISTSAKDVTVSTFEELSEAIYEAKDGDVIKLDADITAEDYGDHDDYAAWENILYIYNDITIDLNGHDISLSTNDIYCFSLGENNCAVNVTITDTSTNPGTISYITAGTSETLYAFEIKYGSTLTVEKIKVEQLKSFGGIFDCPDGNIIINSGNYTIYEYWGSIIQSSVNPWSMESPKCSVTINGGTFEILNLDDALPSEAHFLEAYNTIVEINGGTFKGFTGTGLALSGCDTTINYANFNTLNTCIRSREITELDRYYPSSLIINDGIFKSNEDDTIIVASGDATINGGSFTTEEDGATALDIEFGNVTINNGTFVSKYYYGIDLFYKGSLVINDCEARGLTAGLCIGDEESHELEDEYDEIDVFDLTLNGGKYTATLAYPSDYFDEIDDPEELAEYQAYIEMTSGGIYIDYGYDLTDYLGEGYFYFSENGKNQFISSADYHVMKTENIVGISKDKSTIIDGKDQSIEFGKDNTISIKSDAAFRWFMDGNTQIGEVKVDGKTVDSKNFTAEAGSTKITFKADYLKTLSEGTHKVQIISNVIGNKLVAETTITVKAAPIQEEEKIANTADNNMIGAFVALSTLSAAGFVSLKKKED